MKVEKQRYRDAMKVEVRGVVYPNARTAARELGVSVSAVYSALHRGSPDTIGLGRAHGLPRGSRSQSVVIGPLTFKSMKAASVALGFNAAYLSQVRYKGDKRAWERVVGRAMEIASRAPAQ